MTSSGGRVALGEVQKITFLSTQSSPELLRRLGFSAAGRTISNVSSFYSIHEGTAVISKSFDKNQHIGLSSGARDMAREAAPADISDKRD